MVEIGLRGDTGEKDATVRCLEIRCICCSARAETLLGEGLRSCCRIERGELAWLKRSSASWLSSRSNSYASERQKLPHRMLKHCTIAYAQILQQKQTESWVTHTNSKQVQPVLPNVKTTDPRFTETLTPVVSLSYKRVSEKRVQEYTGKLPSNARHPAACAHLLLLLKGPRHCTAWACSVPCTATVADGSTPTSAARRESKAHAVFEKSALSGKSLQNQVNSAGTLVKHTPYKTVWKRDK